VRVGGSAAAEAEKVTARWIAYPAAPRRSTPSDAFERIAFPPCGSNASAAGFAGTRLQLSRVRHSPRSCGPTLSR